MTSAAEVKKIVNIFSPCQMDQAHFSVERYQKFAKTGPSEIQTMPEECNQRLVIIHFIKKKIIASSAFE